MRFDDIFHASHLTTFGYCPRRFKYAYVDKIEPIFRSWQMVVGTAYHNCLYDIHEQDLFDVPIKKYETLFRDKLDETEFVEDEVPVRWMRHRDEVIDKQAEIAGDLLQNYCSHDFNRNCEILYAEAPLKYNIHGYEFEGRLDQVRKYKNQIILVDFKSGKGTGINDWSLKLSFQLGAYAHACKENFGFLPDRMGIYLIMDHRSYEVIKWRDTMPKLSNDSTAWKEWFADQRPEMITIEEYEAMRTAEKFAKSKNPEKLKPFKSRKKNRNDLAFRVGLERGPGLYTVKVTEALITNITKDIQRVCAAIRRAEYYRNPISCSNCRFYAACDRELAMDAGAKDEVEALTGW